MADIPPYVKSPDQENYNEELNQTLGQAIGNNGFQITTLTDAQLRTNRIVDAKGDLTTVALLSPDGTMWYVPDRALGAAYVGKIGGALRAFSTVAY